MAHPLNILALLVMADSVAMSNRRPEEPPLPLMPTVARLYTQSGYRRASTKPGPGTQLVQLIDAQAAIGTWQQRAVLRQAAFEQATRERDALLAAVRQAAEELASVTPSRSYPAAVSAYALLHWACGCDSKGQGSAL